MKEKREKRTSRTGKRKTGRWLEAMLLLFILIVIGAKQQGIRVFAVTSGSMEPELPVGAMIITRPVTLAQLEIGDDITFVMDESLTVVTHRIIELGEDNRVTTQGLANNIPDRPVRVENIVGRVEFSVPYLGYALSWLSTRLGKVITITILVSIFLIIEILIVPKKKQGGIKHEQRQ